MPIDAVFAAAGCVSDERIMAYQADIVEAGVPYKFTVASSVRYFAAG